MESINALAHRLIDAARLNDFSTDRFKPLEQLTQSLIESHDKLSNGSFIAFRNFDLWNAWYRIWVLGGFYSTLRFRRAHVQYRRTKDRRFLDNLEKYEHFGTPSPEMDEYQEMFQNAYAIMLDVEANRLTTRGAVTKLLALYRNKPWIPPGYGLDDPTRRYATAGDLKSLVLSSYWGYRRAPMEVRHRYFDFPPIELVKDVWKGLVQEQRWVRRLRDASRYAAFGRHRSAQSPLATDMHEAVESSQPPSTRMATAPSMAVGAVELPTISKPKRNSVQSMSMTTDMHR